MQFKQAPRKLRKHNENMLARCGVQRGQARTKVRFMNFFLCTDPDTKQLVSPQMAFALRTERERRHAAGGLGTL